MFLSVVNNGLGLGSLLGGIVLLLTTIGRKTGKPRVTALAYNYEPATDTYYVVAGWGDRSSWYCNLIANPNVYVRVENREFDAVAKPAPEATALALFAAYKKCNPYTARVWHKLTGVPFEDSDAGLRHLAALCPVIALR